jgi:hypothetical protein
MAESAAELWHAFAPEPLAVSNPSVELRHAWDETKGRPLTMQLVAVTSRPGREAVHPKLRVGFRDAKMSARVEVRHRH